MKISLSWLNDHVDLTDYADRPTELARLLTAVGLEVETVENRALSFHQVVVGQVVKLDRHPNADRLTVCQVDAGEGALRQIVCGARNHRAGDKVVVTLPGAVLPGNFEIKKSVIREVESSGMLASESELGLREESEGILILPADAPVGVPFARYYGLDDVVFEINVSPNRADCLSHLGLARELGCLLGKSLKTRALQPKSDRTVAGRAALAVEVRDPKLCPRYAGRVIKGVSVGPSPSWLAKRLECVGLKSINNVVDVTNFIMMDWGQPLHAFDLSTFGDGRVIVDRAAVGEKFIALDDRELVLTGDELTIRDGQRAVCLAGVIGGRDSGVKASTRDLFVESAHFAFDSIRKTARRYGLQTDSAYRFSRGTDPSAVSTALDRACALIQDVAGGQVAHDHWDEYPHPVERKPIRVSSRYVSQRLGYPVASPDLKKVLSGLGCEVTGEESDELRVVAPLYRMDLEQEVDFVEEYGRLAGYDKIPETLPALAHAPLPYDSAFTFEQRVVELARGAGLAQAVNFGFTGSKVQVEVLGPVEAYRGVGLEMDPNPIAIRNPLSEDLDVMRVSLVPGLLRNMLHNVRHEINNGSLFEVGQVFRRGPDGYQQDPRLGVVSWGVRTGLWQKSDDESRAFFGLKTRLLQILEKLGISQVQWIPWTSPSPLVHPGQCAMIFVEGRNVGFLGSLHPKRRAAEKLRVPVVVGELDLRSLGRGQPRTIKFKAVSKFPAAERDLAFAVPRGVRAQDIAQEIKRTAGGLLQSVEVFDVFEGGNLPPEHSSIAFRMVYQDQGGTLTDEKLNQVLAQIVASVDKKLSVKVR